MSKYSLFGFARIVSALLVFMLVAACGQSSSGSGGSSATITPKSSNANLATLNVALGELFPEFQPVTNSYKIYLPINVKRAVIELQAEVASATIVVDTKKVSGGSHEYIFNDGQLNANVNIVVTAEDGKTQKKYLLRIIRSEASENTLLEALALTGVQLTPAFSPDITEYSASVDALTSVLSVTAWQQDTKASVFIYSAGEWSLIKKPQLLALDVGTTQIVVDVKAEDGIRSRRYSISVHRTDPQKTEEYAYLKPDELAKGDRFGFSIAAADSVLVIGAPTKDSAFSSESIDVADQGAVFAYSVTDHQILKESILAASNAGAGDLFGWSVSLNNDRLLVGAPGEDGGGAGFNTDAKSNSKEDSGAAYIFHRSGSAWQQVEYIKASNSDAGDLFGHALAIDEQWMAISAIGEASISGEAEDNSAKGSGAVYLFERGESAWRQRAILKAPYLSLDDNFGASLALKGRLLVVGAPNEDSDKDLADPEKNNALRDSGAVYVYALIDNNWQYIQALKAKNADRDNHFGSSVAIAGNTIAVGAPHENSSATGLNSDSDNRGADQSGAVYLYRWQDKRWRLSDYVKASNTYPFAKFGQSISASDNGLLIGSPGESSPATGVNGNQQLRDAIGAGAAYLFVNEAGTWKQQAYLKASTTKARDLFGTQVAIYEDVSIIAVPNEDGVNSELTNSGAVYLYKVPEE